LAVDLANSQSSYYSDRALESEVLYNFWHKALASLQSLQTPEGITASGQDGHFHAIFGRDSLWTVLLALEAGRLQQHPLKTTSSDSLQTSVASFRSWLYDLSATILRGLGNLQGRVVNDVNEEQPGRIVHEYWNPVPQKMISARWPVADGKGRYYGAFDATFLYLITIARVDSFFDDNALLDELWLYAEAALHWMLEWSDLDHDGRVEYSKRNPEGIGLDNQVWKDSSESIQPHEHTPLQHPLAWVEVQGYAWAAYASYLQLARKRDCLDPSLEQEIQSHMNGLLRGLQSFWLDGERFPAIALDGQKKPVPAVSSNPGHLLWSGCIEKSQAEQICIRLLQPDMLTPWGLRTLSEHAYYYNPIMYHCGAVWPFDNAVAINGLWHYGFKAEAERISRGVMHAILAFDAPIELYTVQPSRWLRSPRIEQEWFLADYFHACNVQAWTAAAILYLTSLLMN
jgi:glycogen debranching enzyme